MTDPLQAEPPRAVPSPLYDNCLALRLLDALDVAVMAIDADLRLLHANRRGLARLAEGAPLRLAEGLLWPTVAALRPVWTKAVAGAVSDGPRYHALPAETGGTPVVIGLVALEPSERRHRDGAPHIAVLVGASPAESAARASTFAALHGLTPAETRVLLCLAAHLPPKRIATKLGLAEATVRSHVSSILAKAEVSTTRVLTARLAALPPIA
ncbi:MAG: helix-turn-helix transcriptional regulator [Lautropia sp.]